MWPMSSILMPVCSIFFPPVTSMSTLCGAVPGAGGPDPRGWTAADILSRTPSTVPVAAEPVQYLRCDIKVIPEARLSRLWGKGGVCGINENKRIRLFAVNGVHRWGGSRGRLFRSWCGRRD